MSKKLFGLAAAAMLFTVACDTGEDTGEMDDLDMPAAEEPMPAPAPAPMPADTMGGMQTDTGALGDTSRMQM